MNAAAVQLLLSAVAAAVRGDDHIAASLASDAAERLDVEAPPWSADELHAVLWNDDPETCEHGGLGEVAGVPISKNSGACILCGLVRDLDGDVVGRMSQDEVIRLRHEMEDDDQ